MLVVQRPGPVKYAEILNMELQLRECPMPEGLSVPILATPDHGLPDDATTKHLQRFTALIMRESGTCYASLNSTCILSLMIVPPLSLLYAPSSLPSFSHAEGR